MPIPFNSRIVIDGDSHAQQGNVFDESASGQNQLRASWPNMAMLHAGSPGYVPYRGNLAVTGTPLGPVSNALSILGRQAACNAMLGSGPSVLLLSAMGNDIAAGRTAAAILSDLDTYIAASVATYIIIPTVPRRFGEQAFSSGQEAVRAAVNAGIMARKSKKFRPVNVEGVVNNVGQTFDGIHLIYSGASAVGLLCGRELSRLVEGWGADAFPVADGNFVLPFSGNGGIVMSASGVISTGYVLTGADKGDATVNGSIDADGLPMITFGGSYSGDWRTARIYREAAYPSTIVEGDTVEAFIDFQVIDPLLNICWIAAAPDLKDAGGAVVANALTGHPANSGPDIALGPGRYCSRVTFKSRGTVTNAVLFGIFGFNGGADVKPVRGKIKVHGLGVRPVTV